LKEIGFQEATRAGVSIGINLNINNACNWRCIYCQVPNLSRGTPPPINLALLEKELRDFLNKLLHGNFMNEFVDEKDRHLMDIAFSGNGEPTSAKDFPEVLGVVEKVLEEFDLLNPTSHSPILPDPIKVRLITNGSLMDKAHVLESMKHLANINGEVWFKVDAGTSEGIAKINDVNMSITSVIKRLKACAENCPTFFQTCCDASKFARIYSEANVTMLLSVTVERICGRRAERARRQCAGAGRLKACWCLH